MSIIPLNSIIKFGQYLQICSNKEPDYEEYSLTMDDHNRLRVLLVNLCELRYELR